MTSIEILKEEPITLTEVQEKINSISKRNKELSALATKTKAYAEHFGKLDKKKVKDLKDKLTNLKIPRLKNRHYVKLIDILPDDIDSLRTVFVGETVTVKQEDLNRILEVIKKHA